MTIIKIVVELRTINKKNAYVIETFLILNGFSAAINKNAEDLTGIILNVQDCKVRILKMRRILILTLHAKCAKEKIYKMKV